MQLRRNAVRQALQHIETPHLPQRKLTMKVTAPVPCQKSSIEKMMKAYAMQLCKI